MSKSAVSTRRTSEPKYPINPEAFAFLPKCSTAAFDLTSAGPLNPNSSGIFPPAKVLQLMQTLDFDSLSDVHGTSRGEEPVLQECISFFNRNGVVCGRENVSLNDNILSAIEHVYSRLELSETRKILVPTPTFGYYFQQFKDKKIGFEILPTKSENGFLPDPKELESAIISSGAVALLLCYPNNPTGVVMTQECAYAIADVTKRHNVFIISDEAFINNSLSEKKHFPIAAVEGILENSFTVTGAAKSIFVGHRNSFCVGNAAIVDSFEKLGGYPTKQTQKTLAAAIENSAENIEYLDKCRAYYLNNIDVVKAKSEELNQLFCQQYGEEKTYVKPFIANPDSTSVYLLDFSGLRGKQRGGKVMNTGLDVSRWLLEDASIGTVPGECFLFEEKEMLVRIELSHTPQEIAMAFGSAKVAASKIQNSPSIAPAPNDEVKKLTNDNLVLEDIGVSV